MKFFNTAGPVRQEYHYTLDLLGRINLEEVLMLIEQQKYFILHAPRQTGKTSALLALQKYLNNEGKYYCVYVNVEDAQAARENISEAIQSIVYRINESSKNVILDNKLLPDWKKILSEVVSISALYSYLKTFCQNIEKPLILLIDEIDSLVGDSLISVLRQLRSGYNERPDAYPQSIILCGVRDVRDYRIHSTIEKTIITGGSAFNITAKSIRLGNFEKGDIKKLYLKHTEETGQKFEEDVFEDVWELTEGQPWLVNALAYECCFELQKDRTKSITKEMIELAKENMILRRDTHIDILIDKLSEDRVQRVIEPILYSEEGTENLKQDDLSYVEDMGLIKRKQGKFVISNAIYKEIIPRELVYTTQYTMSEEPLWYIEKGKLQMEKLLKRFQQFYRENSEVWLEKFAYKEAGPHLLLMAFLQRIINGGGRIHREYGLGRKRIDLLIEYGEEKFCIETKVFRSEKTKETGLNQLQDYIDKCGAKEGHLVIFDKTDKKKWEEKIYTEQISPTIKIFGM